MPATQLQLRRGSTAEHTTFTGAEGEVTIDTTKLTAVVHDSVTAGGHPLLKEAALDADGSLAANSDSKIATQKAVKTYAQPKTMAGPVVGETNIEAALAEMAARLAARVGSRFHHGQATPPAGAIAEDGSVIAVATYPELCAEIYCGDAANPTAEFYYRCTDTEDPTGSRSTTGDYLVLADRRGEFDMGWDNGRGVDSGRALWAHQDDGLPNLQGSAAIVTNSNVSQSGVFTRDTYNINVVPHQASAVYETCILRFDASNSNSKFGAHDRVTPPNVAGLACIWYE